MRVPSIALPRLLSPVPDLGAGIGEALAGFRRQQAAIAEVGRKIGEPARQLRLAIGTYRSEIWPRRVKLAAAFGWQPDDILRMDLVDLREYIALAEDYPDALGRMRAFGWTSVAPDPGGARELRDWLRYTLEERQLGKLAALPKPAPRGPAGQRAPVPGDLSRRERKMLSEAREALASDPSVWHVKGQSAGRPIHYQLAKRTGAMRDAFRPHARLGKAIEPELGALWLGLFGEPRPH